MLFHILTIVPACTHAGTTAIIKYIYIRIYNCVRRIECLTWHNAAPEVYRETFTQRKFIFIDLSGHATRDAKELGMLLPSPRALSFSFSRVIEQYRESVSAGVTANAHDYDVGSIARRDRITYLISM